METQHFSHITTYQSSLKQSRYRTPLKITKNIISSSRIQPLKNPTSPVKSTFPGISPLISPNSPKHSFFACYWTHSLITHSLIVETASINYPYHDFTFLQKCLKLTQKRSHNISAMASNISTLPITIMIPASQNIYITSIYFVDKPIFIINASAPISRQISR